MRRGIGRGGGGRREKVRQQYIDGVCVHSLEKAATIKTAETGKFNAVH